MNEAVSRVGRRRRALLGWLLGGLIGAMAIMPLCDLNFDCGCSWPWRGGMAHCDIRTAGPPDCPWCDDLSFFAPAMLFSYGLALGGSFLIADKLSFPLIVLVALAWVLVGILLAGAFTSLALDLPVLSGWDGVFGS